MSYADVSLAASSSQAVSTPLYAGTTFNFQSPNSRGDVMELENNPILPSTATSTKATQGNALSDTAVPITTNIPAAITTTGLNPNLVLGIGAAIVLIGGLIAAKHFKLF